MSGFRTFKEKVERAQTNWCTEFKKDTGFDMPLVIDWTSLQAHCDEYADETNAVSFAASQAEEMINAMIGVYKTGSKVDMDIVDRMHRNFKGLTITAGKVEQTQFVVGNGHATLTFPIEGGKKWKVEIDGWRRSLYDGAPKKAMAA